MGIFEPHVGYGSRNGETGLKQNPRAITVISLAQTEFALAAAAALGVCVTVISAPNAAQAVGPGWFDAVIAAAQARYPDVRVTAILDCGDAPGHALAALRHGVKAIRYNGPSAAQIDDIAAQSGAVLFRERPESLDLYDKEVAGLDLFVACRDWLG
jgi:alkanesulfonate monooxygenase SsuD/methylene tetrahydromethanopterin reductase-like flavin-dependent oxidoreductase (luciferase family)